MLYVLYGVLVGLFLSILTGPVFFRLIQTSVNHGFRQGVYFALGVSAADISYATLSYLGLSALISEGQVLFWIAKIGSVVIVLFGASSIWIFFKGSVPELGKQNFYSKNYFIQGVSINILSPGALFYWVGIVAFARIKLGLEESSIPLFLGFALFTVLSMDTLKSYLAEKLRILLSTRLIRNMNLMIGIILVIFGIQLWLADFSELGAEKIFEFNLGAHY